MLAERSLQPELMDDPHLPEATYRAVLGDLAKVNRITLAHRATLAFLDRAIGHRQSFTLLDVGFGQGDMLRVIARWASDRGIAAQLTGIDLNPRSEPIARLATPATMPIRYRTGDYAALAGSRFDCIISSLVTHHMSRVELLAFLQFMEAEAQTGWLVNDLHRHTISYLGYPVLARLARWHEIVRQDGQTSIARSFRPADWRELLTEAQVAGVRIIRRFPFRLCVEQVR